MQQKSLEGKKSTWQEMSENAIACKPFRCPQCGDHTRFRNLSSLSAHLDYNHRLENKNMWGKNCLFSSLSMNDKVPCSEQLDLENIGNFNSVKKYSFVQFSDLSPENLKNKRFLDKSTKTHAHCMINKQSGASTISQNSMSLGPNNDRTSYDQEIVETTDKANEKRMNNLAKELSTKTAELLDIQSAFLQLSWKKQEIQQRERALNRQVDVAVELIAGLRQRLSKSEDELLKKEEEVIAINNFLETAAEKEFQGKVKLCHFIENLLQRVDLAEKQLEYYQIQKNAIHRSQNTKEPVPANVTQRKHSHLSNANHYVTDAKSLSIQTGRMLDNKYTDGSMAHREVYCKPTVYSRGSCNEQKKSDSLISGRNVNNKYKVGKKAH
ncbi:protein ZNF365 [Pleurodeles waltl]